MTTSKQPSEISNAAFFPSERIWVPVTGGELALHRYGEVGNNSVLAIHGVTSSNRAWQSFAKALTQHGFTIYAVDLRGRGDSNQLPGPFGMVSHANDMAKIVDYLGLENLDVIGHSMGGFVTAAMLALHPEKVKKATLIDGGIPLALPAGMSVDQVLPLVLGPAMARLAMNFESIDAYRDYWKPQAAFVKGWSPALDEYIEFDLKGSSPNLKPATNPKSVEEDSRDLFESELISKTLQNLDREVLFLRAQRGLQNEEVPLYPQPVIDAVLPQYPKVKLIQVEDVNHYDILLNDEGAAKCAEIIYGVKA
jgi:pimeloyl-ACP methyl ester carboxylesterase